MGLGVTVSIGVSWNKIFVKLGSDYKKPDAITEFSKDNYKDIAWKLPAGDLLMVGRRKVAVIRQKKMLFAQRVNNNKKMVKECKCFVFLLARKEGWNV